MDNNFNQQVPQNQQPVYQQQIPQQPVYQQQAPQQPGYQQAPQQQMYQAAPKKPSNGNTMEIISLILSAVGAFMAVLGSIFTCTCSASKTWDISAKELTNAVLKGDLHSMSLVWLVAFFGAIIAIAGVVLAILEIKKNGKKAKLAYIAVAVGGFGFMYGMLSILTICGYNCSLDSSMLD